MKKIFVMLPPEKLPTAERAGEYMRKREELCHRVEVKLGEYCEVSYLRPYGLQEYDRGDEYTRKEYLRDNLEQVLYSDYAVFGEGSTENEECRLVQHVAEAYGVPILEM
ncbi:MAG: hypothetical protein IJG37_03840 [Synergistaceae bacterium]|nr:hypothetical protein [Synergistaceae bacterium]